MRLYEVHVACNDPDSGLFCNKAQGIQLAFGRGDYIELGMCGAREPGFTLHTGPTRFRLGRFMYNYENSRDWVGNWCWNAYRLRPLTMAKLLFDLMRDKRWACEAGPCEAYDAYHAKDGHAFMSIWSRLMWPPKPALIVGSAKDETP